MGRVSDFGAWVVRLAPFLFAGVAAVAEHTAGPLPLAAPGYTSGCGQ